MSRARGGCHWGVTGEPRCELSLGLAGVPGWGRGSTAGVASGQAGQPRGLFSETSVEAEQTSSF